jgi:hypothetical protein
MKQASEFAGTCFTVREGVPEEFMVVQAELGFCRHG